MCTPKRCERILGIQASPSSLGEAIARNVDRSKLREMVQNELGDDIDTVCRDWEPRLPIDVVTVVCNIFYKLLDSANVNDPGYLEVSMVLRILSRISISSARPRNITKISLKLLACASLIEPVAPGRRGAFFDDALAEVVNLAGRLDLEFFVAVMQFMAWRCSISRQDRVKILGAMGVMVLRWSIAMLLNIATEIRRARRYERKRLRASGAEVPNWAVRSSMNKYQQDALAAMREFRDLMKH